VLHRSLLWAERRRSCARQARRHRRPAKVSSIRTGERGTLRNYPRALACLEQAASSGVAEAQTHRGLMHNYGEGVKRDAVVMSSAMVISLETGSYCSW
jgi:TPR repeat protein